MTTLAEVRLWGRTIGAVALADQAEVATFQYAPDFCGSGIELAPLTMPLGRRIYSFPELSRPTFHGLPGLLADALPDAFGNTLIDAWLASQGRLPTTFNAVERLCYTGTRGMGALEFVPAIGQRPRTTSPIKIDQLVELASQVLTHRHDLQASFADSTRGKALADILKVGTSAGGARAKAIIAWNPATHEVRSGQIPAGPGFQYWLLKFDGVSANRDKELADPKGYGLVEYAYSRMATDAGIRISDCRLFHENGRSHFMTRRFDRGPGGEKLHLQSLSALAHYDFNLAGAYSYEQAMQVIRRLGLTAPAVEEMFLRMVFNIVARNQDDHVKNIAFLMDKSGSWSLAPAFDLTWSYNPAGLWTASHQMTVSGKRDGFSLADLLDCARTAAIKSRRAKAIVAQVVAVVGRWRDYAEESGIDPSWRDQIQGSLRLAW